jgi:hypothetical protein
VPGPTLEAYVRILSSVTAVFFLSTVACTGGGDLTTPDGNTPSPDVSHDSAASVDSTATDSGTADTSTVAPDTGTVNDTGQTQPTGELDNCDKLAFLDLTNAPTPGPNYGAATLTATCDDTYITVTGNGLPPYTFVPLTPNALTEQDHNIQIPRFPKTVFAPGEESIPFLGLAGLAVNGAEWFGPNEGPIPDNYGDPEMNGITDGCSGHTAFAYHYHALVEKCLTQASLVSEPWDLPEPDPSTPSPIIGYALDGFPIYGPYGCADKDCAQVVRFKSSWEATGYEKIGCSSSADCGNNYRCGKAIVDGNEVNRCGSLELAWEHNSCAKDTCKEAAGEWLDQCNGRVGADGTYRYHATDTFPYILGCYRGTAEGTGGNAGRGGDPGGNPGGTDPENCETNADCADACPDESKGCVCHTAKGGPMAGQQICVPSCSTSADCPTDMNGGQMNCTPDGICAPAMPGGGMP